MTEIERIMQLEVSRWIREKIKELPDSGKFRAASAIRSLQWANANYAAQMPIPAAYFALHATEEAVASFISCAKVCGYGDDAKINLRDHQAKATVSLLAQQVWELLPYLQTFLAVQPESDTLVVKLTVDGEVRYYDPASTKLFHFTDRQSANPKPDFFDDLIEEFGKIEKLKQSVIDGQEARNTILYATKKGLPTGFLEPEVSLKRECLLTLGLIWTAIDVVRNRGEQIPFVAQSLRTANLVIASMKKNRGMPTDPSDCQG